MFWLNKNKTDKTAGKKRTDENAQADSGKSVGKIAGQRSSSDLRTEALAHAKAARENIGEDTLNKIAAAMTKKQQSATEAAKRDIADADADRVAQEILWMMEEKA